jgi:predicted ATPase
MAREACCFFEALATERLLTLVFEDLHWADFATIDFLSALRRRRSSAKLMLIGSYRPEDLRMARHSLKQMTRDLALRKYCEEIELAPLADAAITELLNDGVTGEAVPAGFAQFIKERTGGNPLFMHDVSRGLQILDEVLALCERQTDPIQQDLTRIYRLCSTAVGNWLGSC